MFRFNQPWELVLFETPEAGGGGDDADKGGDKTPEIGMEGIRAATLNGLDESYHEDWNSMSQRITTPSDLAKNYVESQRAARSAIRIPGEDAKPEDWDDIYTKLGRPKDAKEYQFSDVFGEGENTYKVTDEDKAFRQNFAPVAHKLGLSQRQVAGLEAFQFENNKVLMDAREAKAEDITSKNVQVLEQQHGLDFDTNKNRMLTASKHYAGNDWEKLSSLQLADGTFLLDNPVWFNMMAKIGAERQEDFREPNAFNESARNDAQAEYDKIRREAMEKGLLPTSPGWPTEQLQKLSDRIHGTTSAVGARFVSN
jgi:hypothetical protein